MQLHYNSHLSTLLIFLLYWCSWLSHMSMMFLFLTDQSRQCLPCWSWIHTNPQARLADYLFFPLVFCDNNPKSIDTVAWYTMWHSFLQEWSSPSQVWLMGRTWTVVDTKSAWVSSWRHKDSEAGQMRREESNTKEPTCENTTKVHSATRKYISLWVLHTYAHILWP